MIKCKYSTLLNKGPLNRTSTPSTSGFPSVIIFLLTKFHPSL